MERPDVSRRTVLKGGGAALAGLSVLRISGPTQAFPGHSGAQDESLWDGDHDAGPPWGYLAIRSYRGSTSLHQPRSPGVRRQPTEVGTSRMALPGGLGDSRGERPPRSSTRLRRARSTSTATSSHRRVIRSLPAAERFGRTTGRSAAEF
jgi:hypothetical protein